MDVPVATTKKDGLTVAAANSYRGRSKHMGFSHLVRMKVAEEDAAIPVELSLRSMVCELWIGR